VILLLVFAGAAWAGASLMLLIAGMVLFLAAGEVSWWAVPLVGLAAAAVMAGGLVSMGYALEWTGRIAATH